MPIISYYKYFLIDTNINKINLSANYVYDLNLIYLGNKIFKKFFAIGSIILVFATLVNIIIYFPNENATALLPEVRNIKSGSNDVLIDALNDLLIGTKQNGSVNIIPKGTKLYGLEVKNKIAYVNFSKEFVKNFNGGSTGEIFLVGSIVNTLTEFPQVTSVVFMVDGKPIDTIAGHMDLTEPVKRMDNIINKK